MTVLEYEERLKLDRAIDWLEREIVAVKVRAGHAPSTERWSRVYTSRASRIAPRIGLMPRPPRDDTRAFLPQGTVDRLRDAIARENEKPAEQRRAHLLTKWRRELNELDVREYVAGESE